MQNNNTISIFESIKHIDEKGDDFWYARDLAKSLMYTDFRNFKKVLNKAVISCKSSNIPIREHVVEVNVMLVRGNNAKSIIDDYKLSRYACYLIAQNADPRKEVVALVQTCFAIQTRKQELFESEYDKLSEDEKRIYQRNKQRKNRKK